MGVNAGSSAPPILSKVKQKPDQTFYQEGNPEIDHCVVKRYCIDWACIITWHIYNHAFNECFNYINNSFCYTNELIWNKKITKFWQYLNNYQCFCGNPYSRLPVDLENLENLQKFGVSPCDLGNLENQGKFFENLKNICFDLEFLF